MDNKHKAYTDLAKTIKEARLDENPLGLGRILMGLAAKKGARKGASGLISKNLRRAAGTAGNALAGALGAKAGQKDNDGTDQSRRIKSLEKTVKGLKDKRDANKKGSPGPVSLDIFDN